MCNAHKHIKDIGIYAMYVMLRPWKMWSYEYIYLLQIFQAVPRELGITRNLCEQYLSLMTDDSVS